MQATAFGLELYTRTHIATRLAEAADEWRVRSTAPRPSTPGGGASALGTLGRTLLAQIGQGLSETGSSELPMECFPRTCC